MEPTDWYEVVEGPRLLQGDILFRCPILALEEAIPWPPDKLESVSLGWEEQDVLVLTQSCDLENEKVGHVLVAKVISWPNLVQFESQAGNPFVKSKEFRKKLIEGNIPGMLLLQKRSVNPSLTWSIVDFRHLFTLPKPFLVQVATNAGRRLRFCSPYREYLAQGFARLFMRVGLPQDLKSFEKEGEISS